MKRYTADIEKNKKNFPSVAITDLKTWLVNETGSDGIRKEVFSNIIKQRPRLETGA